MTVRRWAVLAAGGALLASCGGNESAAPSPPATDRPAATTGPTSGPPTTGAAPTSTPATSTVATSTVTRSTVATSTSPSSIPTPRATASTAATTEPPGAPVTGGPPDDELVGVESLDRLAVSLGVQRFVASSPDGTVVAWVDGQVNEIPVAADSFPRSDGEHVYWQTSEQVDDGFQRTSFAADLTGRLVCTAPGWMHRVRQRADGSYVASVERPGEAMPSDDEYPVPNFAVDCTTGDEQPIAPRSFHREGGGRTLIDVGGRQFSMDYDAEGNGDVYNERGIPVNGDDYAGFHTFSPTAKRVAYGHYGDIGPHVTDLIVVRDTDDGSLRWETQLRHPFADLVLTDDRLIASVASNVSEPWQGSEALAVYDPDDGRLLVEIPTAIALLAAG